MKIEFTDQGLLVIRPKSNVEEYALNKWWEENINPCTGNFIEGHQFCLFIRFRDKRTLWQKLRHKFGLFYINHFR